MHYRVANLGQACDPQELKERLKRYCSAWETYEQDLLEDPSDETAKHNAKYFKAKCAEAQKALTDCIKSIQRREGVEQSSLTPWMQQPMEIAPAPDMKAAFYQPYQLGPTMDTGIRVPGTPIPSVASQPAGFSRASLFNQALNLAPSMVSAASMTSLPTQMTSFMGRVSLPLRSL